MRKGMLVGITAAATAAVVGTGAWVLGAQAAPKRPTTVCVNKRTGDVRFVSSVLDRCRHGENKIVNWSNAQPVPARVDRLTRLVMVESGAVKTCTVRAYNRGSGVLAVSCTTEAAPTTSPTPSASPSPSASPLPSPSATQSPQSARFHVTERGRG